MSHNIAMRKGTYCPFCQSYNVRWKNKNLVILDKIPFIRYACSECKEWYYISAKAFDAIGDDNDFSLSVDEPSKVLDKMNKKLGDIADIMLILQHIKEKEQSK